MVIAVNYESVLERLNLPENFGYVVLLLALALLLAPYLRKTDFGILKIPDFDPRLRRTLVAVGPLAMVAAILIHVKLLPTNSNDKSYQNNESFQAESVDIIDSTGENENSRLVLDTGSRVLAHWRGSGCLYPATVISRHNDKLTVRFDFGSEAAAEFDDVFPIPLRASPEPVLGDPVYVKLATRGAWAPGQVKDLRNGRILVDLERNADCTNEVTKPYVWTDAEGLIRSSKVEEAL